MIVVRVNDYPSIVSIDIDWISISYHQLSTCPYWGCSAFNDISEIDQPPSIWIAECLTRVESQVGIVLNLVASRSGSVRNLVCFESLRYDVFPYPTGAMVVHAGRQVGRELMVRLVWAVLFETQDFRQSIVALVDFSGRSCFMKASVRWLRCIILRFEADLWNLGCPDAWSDSYAGSLLASTS